MRLRTMAAVCVIAAVIGLLGVLWIGHGARSDFHRNQTRLNEVFELRHAVDQLKLLLDYATLLEPDPEVLAAAANDARVLSEAMEDLAHPAARPGRQHLGELANIVEALATIPDHSPEPPDGRTDALFEVRRNLARQLRIHVEGIDRSFKELVSDRYAEASSRLRGDVTLLMVVSCLLGLFGLLAFLMIYRRVSRPLAAFAAGIRELSEGREEVRVDVRAHDELGELAHAFNNMTSSLARKERDLRDSELRFRQIAETIRDVFWINQPDGRQVYYVSPAFEEIFGLERDVLLRDGEAWQQVIVKDDLPEALRFQREWATQETEAQYRIRRPDGKLRWIHDRAFPVTGPDGTIRYVAGVARDITQLIEQRELLRERVKEQQGLYRAYFLTTETDRPVRDVLQEIVNFLPECFYHEDDAVARIVVDQHEYRSADWQPPVSTRQSEIRDGGRREGYIEVGYRQRHVEPENVNGPFLLEEIRLVDTIAGHIAQMLDTRRTVESLSQSERLNAIGQLTGGVAHDFNNLLLVIGGNAELLLEQIPATSDAHVIASSILDAAERGGQLTQRLLAFARRQPLEPERTDVNTRISGMRPLLERTLGDAVRVEFNLASEAWPVLIDPAQLETALLNLAINARDAMPDGGWLNFETHNSELDEEYAAAHADVTPGDYLLVAVSDTGTGIAPEHLGQVFEPFFTTKEPGKGTGLGLSTVFGFIKQSRGHVSIYSEPGAGTTVKLYLPRSQGSEQAPRASPAPPPPIQGDGRTVVLADDDPMVRRYVQRSLESLGFRVLSAASGREALQRLREHDEVSLLLTDMVMPGGMSGRELAEQARARHPRLRVVYMSGYTHDALSHHPDPGPGMALLSKPFRRTELVAMLESVLGAPQGTAPTPKTGDAS